MEGSTLSSRTRVTYGAPAGRSPALHAMLQLPTAALNSPTSWRVRRCRILLVSPVTLRPDRVRPSNICSRHLWHSGRTESGPPCRVAITNGSVELTDLMEGPTLSNLACITCDASAGRSPALQYLLASPMARRPDRIWPLTSSPSQDFFQKLRAYPQRLRAQLR